MSVLRIDFGTLHSKLISISTLPLYPLLSGPLAFRSVSGIDTILNEVSNRATPFDRTISDPDLGIEKKYLHATHVDVNGTVGAEVNLVIISPSLRNVSSIHRPYEMSVVGIDTIVKQISNRATPACKDPRDLKLQNTIGCLKRIIGPAISDPDLQIEKKYLNATLVDVNGTVGAEVRYLGEKHTFSATQLVAMYFAKLRDITSNELKTAVSDVVIAIPGWYTDIQRRAIQDAAAIAGLNALRLINDTTATALSWGITKTDLPDPENLRNIMFVDVGHSSMSVSVVAFTKGQLVVKGSAYDRHLGGRDIDYALLQHFAKEFKTKYKIDVMSNPEATFRLAKVLSANNEAPLNVESIMNDVDASSELSRDEYEQLIALVLERIPGPLEQALAESGLTVDQIDAVELIGGSTRIPAVRACIQAALGGKPLSTTLIQDEAIARGATFACAFFSPTFRVREFHMGDISHYPIQVCWERSGADPDEDTELTIFPRGNSVPSTKVLTFYRKGPFDIEARYLEPEGLSGGINPWIATFSTKNVPADPRGGLTCVKLKTRLNLHGIMSFDSAYVEEVEEREETAPMDVDGEAAPAEAPAKKRRVKKIDVPFTSLATSLDPAVLEKFNQQEAQMHATDKLVQDTEDRKNALKEYVYDTRGKLDDRYTPYAPPAEKTKLLGMLKRAMTGSTSKKLDALKAVGDPIVARYREAEERPRTIAELRTTLNEYMSQATSSDEKFAHLDPKDKNAVVEKCATIQKWLEDQIARQAERPKNQDGVLKPADILKKKDGIIYFAIPILTKPKPKVVPPNGTQTPQSGTQTPDPGAKQEKTQQDAPSKAEEDVPGPPEMDVD
ncbi:Hsp70 protein-domain-containing protein [Melanogaster broomeanus]|nr:Hsp70 protein-domain-containing protein [Melanogaster broomeanus]